MRLARPISVAAFLGALVALALPIVWTVYLAFFDPVAPIPIMGKSLPAGSLASWIP